MVLAFALGVALWTLAEYVLHRFLGHVHKGRNFFKHEHLQHHAKVNYFAPAIKKAALAVMVSGIMLLLLSMALTWYIALAFIVGFVGMYSLYELTHFRFHKVGPIAMPFIVLRKHHFYHHFHNPKRNFGVTTRFWDRVFVTFTRVEKVNVPYKMAMDWLLGDNGIKDVYSPHFALKTRVSA